MASQTEVCIMRSQTLTGKDAEEAPTMLARPYTIRIHQWLATALLVLAASFANADDLSWTYVEAVVQEADPDIGSADPGLRLEASLGLPLNFYAFGRWESVDIDAVDGDLSAADLGLGWHLGLGETIQGLVELAYTDREAGPFDDDGYAMAVGVRVAPGERWEFGAKAGYRDLERNLDGGYGEAYLLWKPFNLLGFVARAELADEANRFGVGARLSF